MTNQYDPVQLNDYMGLKYSHFTHITQKTLVPNDDEKLYSCRLKLHCEVEYGQYVCVIGSIPELGNWQQYICPMMWTEGHIWVLQQPIVTTKPHFLYKYALMEDDNVVKVESGIARIADLELLPNLQDKSQEFLKEQQKKIKKTSKDAKYKLKALKPIKNVVLTDVWETFQIRWTVNQPFEDENLDMILEGNRDEIDHQVMKKIPQETEWMYNKFGQKVKPYEYVIDMLQNGEYTYPIDFNPDLYKIEYIYSMKNFSTGETVYEREPHRVLHIQDPMHYRGQQALKKTTAQPETHKVFIVNGKIEKVDGNFQGGFFFNRIKDSGIILGTYPLTPNDVLKMKKAGVTAVFNIQTGREMLSRGIDWDEMKE